MRALLFVALTATGVAAQEPKPPYKDATKPVDVRVQDLLGRMTLQ